MAQFVMTAALAGLLTAAVEGRNSQQGFVYAKEGDYKELFDANLVEFNKSQKTGAGKNLQIAVRATDAGVAALQAHQGGGTATNQPAGNVATTSAFQLRKNINIPEVRRRVGDGASKYPFDDMEIGDSFHVPVSEAMPKPAKSLASSVTAANHRFAEKVPGQHKTRKGTMVDNYKLNRKFVIRPVGKDDPDGPGARIWRVALKEGGEVVGAPE